MSDGDILLAAVLADPADDAPRLAYADWLDERGGDGVPCRRCHGEGTVGVTFLYSNPKKPTEPTARLPSGCTTCSGTGRVSNGFAERAEFIRVQCELARAPDPAGWACVCGSTKQGYRKCQACVLRARERELMAGLGGLMLRDVPEGFSLFIHQVSAGPGGDVRYGVVRRGFVAEVRCSTAAFVGGLCGRCEGDGQAHGADRPFEGPPGFCPVCKGERRTPGLAAALAGRQPVTGVVLTDREPYQHPRRWLWNKGNDWWPTAAHGLPNDLYSFLDFPGDTARFPTADAAHAALSAACVAYLCSLAGRGRARPPV